MCTGCSPSSYDDNSISVNAGDDQSVNELEEVTLMGVGSSSVNEDLNFEWKQISGPEAETSDLNTPTLNFRAPQVADYTTISFSLTVSNNTGESMTDSVNIAVHNISDFEPPEDYITVCSYTTPVDGFDYSCLFKRFDDYGYGKIGDFKVTDPERFFVNVEQRLSYLKSFPPELVELACQKGASSDIGFDTYNPEAVVDSSEEPDYPGLHNPLVIGRVHHQYLHNQEAGEMLARILTRWAKAEVDIGVDYLANRASIYQMGLYMPLYVLAYDAIKNQSFFSDNDQSYVYQYLDTLVSELYIFEGQRTNSQTYNGIDVINQAWSQDLGVMIFGILDNNNIYFQHGIRRFFNVLDGMIRPDGSIYFESQRGGAALHYTLYSTAQLLRIAELAYQQGYDLYEVEIDGISLHTIIEFNIGALENSELLHQYTQYQNPETCNPEQCENWNNLLYSDSNPAGFNMSSSWPEFELYRKRFPNSPLVSRYLELFPEDDFMSIAEGPFIQSCEFRSF